MTRSILKTVFWNLIIAAAYIVSGLWGLQLAFVDSNVTLLWPPSGIAMAGLCYWRLNAVPGILIGAVLTNLLNGADPVIATSIGAGNTVGMVIGYGLLRSSYRGDIDFARLRVVIAFIGYGSIVGPLCTALWGTLSLYLAGVIRLESFLETGLIWWLGDAMGVLVLAPAILTLKDLLKRVRSLVRVAELALLLTTVTSLSYFIFFSDLGIVSHYPLIYLEFPFLVWATIRFGPGGGAFLILLLAFFSATSTAAGLGPFTRDDVHSSLLFLHTYLSLFGFTTLLLGAVMEEKRVYLLNLTEASQKADEANRLKSEFLANMSHEIRTPVSVIMGFLEFLKDPDLSEAEKNHHIETIRRNSEHLLGLINDILDLSRIEAGQLPVEKQMISPLSFVEEVSEPFRIRATEKGVNFSIVNEGNIPRFILTDPLRLRQVLSNLLGNAVKFTDRGTIGMHVTGSHTRTGLKLTFAVSDTGPGMTAEQLKKLFQPFSQLDTSSRRRFGGAGLGLAISRRLSELMHGELDVTSEPDVGSRFSLTLLFSRDQCLWASASGDASLEQPASARTERLILGQPRTTKPSALVVEDTPDIQALLKRQLESLGAEVFIAGDGEEALQQVYQRKLKEPAGRFDLILMDIQMPVMDGYETVRRLRDTGYSGKIVALTAHAMEGEERRCLEAGMDGYLSKPVDRAGLREILGLKEKKV
ncbi:MAG: hypothetical protein CMN76_07290 [Spirochaetaceae bacterium]|nr:hypothetical protein [Spirochaetaceae bacterium]|tara:strand:+ start:112844 stop:114940 length:2097 start_codon:yes stop_codon:yes gene_type:complete